MREFGERRAGDILRLAGRRSAWLAALRTTVEPFEVGRSLSLSPHSLCASRRRGAHQRRTLEYICRRYVCLEQSRFVPTYGKINHDDVAARGSRNKFSANGPLVDCVLKPLAEHVALESHHSLLVLCCCGSCSIFVVERLTSCYVSVSKEKCGAIEYFVRRFG